MTFPQQRCPFAGVFTTVLGAGLAVTGLASAADPTLSDCIQANETAIKLRADNKLRQARAQWLLCAAESCNVEIRNACKNRVSEVNRAIPTVVFDARDGDGRDVTAVSVRMDGQPLVPRLEGTAISLDAGEHRFRFEMAGQPSVDKSFVIAEGVKERHETIVIGGTSSSPAAPVSSQLPSAAPTDTGTPPPATVSSSPPPAVTPDVGSNVKTVGLVVGGMGVAGLALGGIFGALSFSNWSSAKSACMTPTDCNNHAQALSNKNDASTDATISTVGFAAGGLALAAGATLFLAPGSGHGGGSAVGLAPSVGPDRAGAVLRGVF